VPQEPHLLGFVIGVSRGLLSARCEASGDDTEASRSRPSFLAWALVSLIAAIRLLYVPTVLSLIVD
jgi:NhaP-type Na+/H+ or K+/H+ antiporter